MNKLRLLLLLTIVSVAGVLGFAKITQAYNIQTGDNVTLSKQKAIYDTVYTAGRTIDINSEIYGDVFCAGQNITVSGTVHGDVICAGQTVNINGRVDGDVRLAGQTVTVSATIKGNATIGGQSLVIDSSGSIGGDLTLGSQDATLNGKVGRDLVVGSGNVTANNSVGRHIKAQSDTLRLSAQARIGGNIDLTSDHNISKDRRAVVGGKITRHAPQHQSKSKHGAIFGFGILWFLYWFIAMLVMAFVLVLLFPSAIHSITNRAFPQPWKALLTGFVASILVPVLVVLVAFTVAGIPLAILIGLLWLTALCVSGPLSAYYLGRLVLSDSNKPLLIMLAGAAMLIALYFIPVLGLIAILAATWIGTGMLLLQIFRTTPKPKYNLQANSPK